MSEDKAHVIKKARFTKESERLSKIVKEATWNVATKVAQIHS